MEIRRAIRPDARAVWEWRNDPVTLAMQPDPTPIPYYVHVDWFTAMLGNPNRVMFIGVDAEPVGYIRFNLEPYSSDPTPAPAEVDVAVAPAHRGKGYGAEMIRLATVELGRTAHAAIKAENVASQRAFAKAGYTPFTYRDHYNVNPCNVIPPGRDGDPWESRGLVFFNWKP